MRAGGFGRRGSRNEAAFSTRARRRCRSRICLGRSGGIEYARHVAGLERANSTEFEEDPKYKVIFKLRDLIGVEALGGTMRLGKYPCELSPGSFAARAYGENLISERHRHRYEVNHEFVPRLREAGSPYGNVAGQEFGEIIERTDHPVSLLPVPPG